MRPDRQRTGEFKLNSRWIARAMEKLRALPGRFADAVRPSRANARSIDSTARAVFTAIMDSSPDWIFVKDRAHRFLMVNRGFAQAVGRTPAEMIGRPDTDFWAKERCEGAPARGIRGFHDEDREALAGRAAHNPEDRVTLPDGSSRIFDTIKFPLRDASGEIFGVLGYARDASAQWRMDAELRASSELLERRVEERTAELAAERNFTETLLQTVGALVVVLDREGRIVRFNRACEIVTGHTAAEVLGRCPWDFLLLPEESGPVRDLFATLRAGHYPNTHENVWLTRDGQPRTIAWSNSVIADADGEVEYVVATGVDITERKAAETALRASEELFRQLTENIQETFFVRDLATKRMVYVSPAYESMWGRPASALYADPEDFLRSIHPDDLPAVSAVRDRQYAGDSYFNFEYRVRRPDGEMRWVWARTFPIMDADGEVYRVAGLVQDVTTRKRAEQALAESEAQFRKMAENINEVFWLVSPDRRTMHYVSPAFEQVWGHPRSALYANPKIVFDMIHPEDRDRIMAELAPQMRGEFRDRYDQEYRIVRPDGELRWLHVRYRTIRDSAGAVYRIAGVGEDVTERKLSEAQRFDQMREQRDALVREVHHRIKNNLQGVVGLLRQHTKQFPLTKGPLEMAIARIQSMALVFGLRSDADAQKVMLCRMVEAIARAVANLTGAAIESRVERHGAYPLSVTQDEAVPVALILNELIFNAVKHQAAASRPVGVDIRYANGCAEVTVIAPDTRLPAGFDFAAGRGLGSGLQLVRSLLPRPAARLDLRDSGTGVVAQLTLAPPVIIAPPGTETGASCAVVSSADV